MKSTRRLKAAALVSGASLAASFGVAKGIEAVAPLKTSAGTGSGASNNVAARRIAARSSGPSTLLIIKRAPNGRRIVYTQPVPQSVPVPAPAAPAAPAAPVTRSS
jgi:hypothetical protein